MKASRILRKLLTTPPQRVIRVVWSKARREWQAKAAYRRDSERTTYQSAEKSPQNLLSYFPTLPVATLAPHQAWIAGLSSHYLANRFDLLGSGWTQVRYAMTCRGMEGHVYAPEAEFATDSAGEWLANRVNAANLAESQRIWQFVSPDYVPIDWQRDFISGYRWDAKTWYKHISYGNAPGADVKVPWELSRMQHLPQLVWAFALAQADTPQFAAPEVYAQTFRNQVLDFIATNPPRYGVNWVCTMDVAIRVANWLVAYDLFKRYGADFDTDFEAIFRKSIYEHALHISTNLEWSDTLRGNHYLADIVGLLFCAAYLPVTQETEDWYLLAAKEFIQEKYVQFNLSDGSNFEGSTAYHRLSGEMVIYAMALIISRQKMKTAAMDADDNRLLPMWRLELLAGIAEFICDITKPNGNIVQFGDNDSGRFLNLQPSVSLHNGVWQTNDLDCRHLVAAIDGVFYRKELRAVAGPEYFERALVHAMILGAKWKPQEAVPSLNVLANPANDTLYHTCLNEWNETSATQRMETVWEFPGEDLRHDVKNVVYICFGLFIWRSERVYLAVRCGQIGQNGNGGHSHNDQLAIELVVDGKDIVVDPGTYVYTPLPETRNAYRSVRAHFAPYVEGREPGDMSKGLFTLGDTAQAKVLYVSPEVFVGRHWGYGSAVTRIIEIEKNAVRIRDCSESLPLSAPQPDKLPYSPGYGKRNLPD